MSNIPQSVEIKTDHAYIQGRNGYWEITAINIWWDDRYVHIDGVGKRGIPINGGLDRILPRNMDTLCQSYLDARRATDPATTEPEDCPKCASDNVTWGHFQPEYEYAYRSNKCNSCGFTFTEEWRFDRWEEDSE